MTVTVDGSQNITVTGTHTWADIVAAGSTNLTTFTPTNGATKYVWAGIITLDGAHTLNITNIELELFRLSRLGSQRGQIVVKNGSRVVFTRCSVLCTAYDFGYAEDNTRSFLRIENTSFIDLFETICGLRVSPSAINSGSQSRIEIDISAVNNSSISSIGAVTGEGCSVTKTTGDVDNLTLNQVGFGIGFTSPIAIKNVTIFSGLYGGINWTYNNFILRSFRATGNPTHDWWSSNQIFTIFVDCTISLSNILVMRNDAALTTGDHKKGASHNLKLVNSSGVAIVGALVTYTGETNANATSDASGIVNEFILIHQRTNLAGMTLPGLGYQSYSKPLATVDLSAYSREIRSYAHQPLTQSITVGAQIGSPTLPFDFSLSTDLGVTQANTVTVGAYTGVSHTASATTISGTRTLAEVYDSRKLHWRNNSGLFPAFVGIIADFGTINVVVSGTLTNPGAKFLDGLQTTGTLTLASPSSINFPVDIGGAITLQALGNYTFLAAVKSTGVVNVVAGLTNLSSWTFTAAATINNSSASAATVSVASTVGIVTTSTGGGAIAIQSVPVLFTGFPTAANINSFAPAATFAIQDVTSSTWTTYDASSGSVSVPLSTLATGANLVLRADARGWYRTVDVTIAASYSGIFDFSNLFAPITDQDGIAIAGLGVQAEKDRVTYNQSASRFELASGVVSFNSLLDKKEELTSSQAGLTLFSSALIRQLIFAKNIYSKVVQIPSPLMVSATISATTSPILTDVILVRTGNAAADVYTHDLTSTAPGLTNRPEIRQSLTTFVSGSSGGGGSAPTTIQIRQEMDANSTRLAEIDAKTAGLNFTGVNVQAIIATLPTIPANWITAAGINAAAFTAAKFAPDSIDSNAIAASAIAEIQTGLATTSAVGAIPTNPLLAGDTRLNSLVNLDTTVSSRLATTGYTAPLTAAQLWGATTASLTTVETIGKLLSDNVNATIASRATPGDVAVSGGFTAGDRTALGAIPTTPLLAGDARLNNLDATISSRSIYNGTDTAGTTTLLTRVTGSVMLTSSYTAPNNTGINDIVAKITKLSKRQGLLPGITATVTDAKPGIPGSLITSDNDVAQTITQVSEGVVRIGLT